jgi:Cu/Ag efflux pump CusA
MFDVLMIFFIVLPCGFPTVPWFLGARWGARGVWLGTFSVVVLLGFFPMLFWVGCGACGQGAIAIFMLGPIWICSALLTVTSAGLAHYKLALKFQQDRKGAGG